MKTAFRYFLAFFIPVHILMIAWTTMLPVLPFYPEISKSNIFRAINHAFDQYLVTTGNAQRWNLFTSVSDIHSQEVVLEVENQKGEKARFDPIIPGLREHDTHRLRHVSLFLRLVYGMDYYAEPYVQRAMKEIEAGGTKVKRGYLLITEKKTRYLENIQKDGIIYYLIPHKYGPYEPSH